MSTNDYRNLQLLASGFVVNNTNVIIDQSYDTSYEIFKVYIFGLTGIGPETVRLRLNGDSSAVYTNLEAGAPSTAVILSPFGTPQVINNFCADLTIYGNRDQLAPIYVIGNTYNTSMGTLSTYPVYSIYSPGMIPMQLNPLTLSFISNDNFSANLPQGTRYMSYGITGRGAAQVFTSNQGG